MNLRKYIGLALLPMVFTACQEDTLVGDQAQGIYTLKATMDKTAPASRAQIVLGGTSTTTETFHWNKGDEMSVFEYVDANSSIDEHSFHISNNYDGQSASAEFTTTRALTEGMNFTALYPAATLTNGKAMLEMQSLYTLKNYSDSSWVDYMSNHMYMVATGTVEKNMSLEMQHLCSLLRVTYTNSTDEEVKINSVAAWGHLCGYRTFSVTNVSEKASDNSRYDCVGVEFEEGITVASGESKDFYILTFSYFDEKNYQWNGLIGFTVACSNNVYLSTPDTYNGQKFLLPDLNPGKAYWFNVTQTADGLVWTKDVNQGEEDDITVTFSNKEFAAALYSVLGADLVTLNPDSTALMKKSDVLSVTTLNFGWNEYKISSLKGIEQFTNLRTLECSYSDLAECDLRKNKALENVIVCGSLLDTLDLSGLTELEYVGCGYSDTLKELILEGCTKVGHIECMSTQLRELNIPNPEKIWQLINNDNPNLKLDLNLYPNLTTLGMDGLGLTELNIPENLNSQLKYLTVGNNLLTSINLAEYPNLEMFSCSGNNITSLDLTAVPKLWMLHCSENKISNLDITSLSALEIFTCGNQKENINLNLKMTAAQYTEWVSNWSHKGDNEGVDAEVEGNAGGGIGWAE